MDAELRRSVGASRDLEPTEDKGSSAATHGPDAPREAEPHALPRTLVGLLLVASAALVVLRYPEDLLFTYVFRTFSPPPTGPFNPDSLASVTTMTTWLSLLFSPVLSILVFYYIGRRFSIDLKASWSALLVFIFSGSALGEVAFALVLVAMGQSQFSTPLSFVLWALAFIGQLVDVGLVTTCLGFAAVSVAALRREYREPVGFPSQARH